MFQSVYDQYEVHCAQKTKPSVLFTALQERRLKLASTQSSGFDRMAKCRKALEALDGCGWQRSYHQRLFHDTFIRACSRVFWKTEKPGQFARDHQRILQFNGWEHLSQEILVSTPRRFGKTISVSMFAAAMLYAAPNVECSIYSTCKRISHKLLRNVMSFLDLIYETLGVPKYKVIRANMEELVVQGPESRQDRRIVNSYPSKVRLLSRWVNGTQSLDAYHAFEGEVLGSAVLVAFGACHEINVSLSLTALAADAVCALQR